MIAHKNILKDIGRILFWYPVRWFALLSSFRVIYSVGRVCGRLDYLVSGRKRIEMMRRGVSDALKCEERDADGIVARNLAVHCSNVLEFVKYPCLNASTMQRVLSFRGLDHLDRQLEKGKGAIVVTAHFGAKQLLQVGLGHSGYNVSQLNYHMEKEELSFIQKNVSQRKRIRIEESLPVSFIPARGFLRPAYECLKENGILLVAGDGIGIRRHMERGFVPFDFLGRKMLFPTNTAAMAKRTGAGIVPAFVVRDDFRHRILIEGPLATEGRTDEETIEQYVRLLEIYVREYPHLWEFWEEFQAGILLSDEDTSSSQYRKEKENR